MDKPCAKYEIIRQIVSQEGDLQNVQDLCRIAGVSKSGYYKWLSSAGARLECETKDRADFELILEAYRYRGYSKGIRGAHMRLLHMSPPVLMNTKKIQRLMHKYGSVCPVRKVSPYRRMAKAMKTDAVAGNLLQRQFRTFGSRKALLTDIAYIPCCGGFFYLSVVKDAYTMQILSYVLSESLEIDFVLETVSALLKIMEPHLTMKHSSTVIRVVTTPAKKFRQIVSDANLRQSMSRRGNCWDNALQESFFGHMKNEIGSRIAAIESFSEAKVIIDDYMDYYNNDRGQWQLAKLTPNEFYEYCLTGEYPLISYEPFTFSTDNL